MNEHVSVIIINWNGKHFLGTCLYSVFRQSYKDLEVLLVDNASKDGSTEYVRRRFSRVKVIENNKNIGFAAANNQAIRGASGKYVLLLNNDAILPKKAIEILVEEMKKKPNSVINPVQYDWGRKYIGIGFAAPWLARIMAFFVRAKGVGPFYSCLACCMTNREILEKYPLNEKLFFFEDTEWSWRLWLENLTTGYTNKTCFYHKYSGTVKNTKSEAFIVGRVAIATYYICFGMPAFLLLLPALLIRYYLFKFIRYLCRNPILALHFALGFVDFLRNMGGFSEMRKNVQRSRKISDIEIIKLMAQSVDFERQMKRKYAKYPLS